MVEGAPAPVAASQWFASLDGPGAFAGVDHWATGMLVLVWLLPPRPSRGPRTAAGAGLGCALLPVTFPIPGAAPPSG
ncbi:hypothetical protein [Streptomyces sp. NPDC047706]|uniref:hypothetical protein n=1 Tax=Streptomyces sp. NPDC047706 TaxID=3365486 RepID=UPI0037115867